MQGHTYQEFISLGREKQAALINQQKQSEPTPFTTFVQFPQIDFIPLNSTQDGKAIKLTTYRYPAEKTKGVVIFFHTMVLYTGISSNVAKSLASNGFTFVGYDQRGHGRSEGEKGYLDDHKIILQDAVTFIQNIFKMYPNTPVFLMGHSFGGLLSILLLRQLKQYKFSGIIVSSPVLKRPQNHKILAAISTFALKIMPNRAGIFSPTFENLCRNPNASAYLTKDPLVQHDKVYAGTLTQIMQLMEKNEQNTWNQLDTCPLVIIQGQYDKSTDPNASIQFYEAIKTKDKELWWYPECGIIISQNLKLNKFQQDQQNGQMLKFDWVIYDISISLKQSYSPLFLQINLKHFILKKKQIYLKQFYVKYQIFEHSINLLIL